MQKSGRNQCPGTRNALFRLPSASQKGACLTAVPTIVIAHTFCASRDARVFQSVMLSKTVMFLRGLKLSVERRSL